MTISPEKYDRLDRLVSATITASLDSDDDTAMRLFWGDITDDDMGVVIGLLISHVRDTVRCWANDTHTHEDPPTDEEVLAIWERYLRIRKAAEEEEDNA
jgi:hypothetical protein